MLSFPCTSCGACCRSLAGSEDYRDLDRGDGTCKHFDDHTFQCMIYEERPEKCRIDDYYEQHLADRYTREQYYRLNRDACNALQTQFSLPECYRIIIPR